MMRTLIPLALLPAVSGCAWVDVFAEGLVGLSNPVAGMVVVLDVVPPDDPDLEEALEAADFPGGTAATVLLANAASAVDMENPEDVLIKDATVTLAGRGIPFDAQSKGYTIKPDDEEPLVYEPGVRWKMAAQLPDREKAATLSVKLPESPEPDVEQILDPDSSFDVTIPGAGADQLIAAVIRVGIEPELVWTNQPTGVEDTVDLVLNKEKKKKLTVPARALPEEGLYLFGIAGVNKSKTADIDNLNIGISAFLAGSMQILPISAGSPIVAQTQMFGVELPSDPNVRDALELAGWSDGIKATAFVANPLSFGVLEGADLDVEGELADELDPGVYEVPSDAGLPYEEGEEYTIAIDNDVFDKPSKIRHTLPKAIKVDVPDTHQRNKRMSFDVSGQKFEAVFATVIDATGAVTHTSLPATADEIKTIFEGGEEVNSVEIPKEAFPSAGVYAVGLSGVTFADSEDMTDINRDLSISMAGKLLFTAVTVIP